MVLRSFNIPEDLDSALSLEAEKRGLSKSQLIRLALKDAISPEDSDFDSFWSLLPSEMKKGKAQARRHWKRLSQKDRSAAKNFIPTYKAQKKKEGTSFKYGSSYLGARPWEDEGWQKEAAAKNLAGRRCSVPGCDGKVIASYLKKPYCGRHFDEEMWR